MKNLLLSITTLLLFFAFTSVSYGQNVPAKAKDAFSNKFPNAQQVNWGMEGSDEYEAEFTLSGTKMSANFDANGNWKETETAISQNQLPDAVKKSLSQKFKKADVKQAYKVENSDRTVYEVGVKNEEEHEMNEEEEESGEHGEMEENEKNIHEMVFTKDGKVVNKKENEEDED